MMNSGQYGQMARPYHQNPSYYQNSGGQYGGPPQGAPGQPNLAGKGHWSPQQSPSPVPPQPSSSGHGAPAQSGGSPFQPGPDQQTPPPPQQQQQPHHQSFYSNSSYRPQSPYYQRPPAPPSSPQVPQSQQHQTRPASPHQSAQYGQTQQTGGQQQSYPNMPPQSQAGRHYPIQNSAQSYPNNYYNNTNYRNGPESRYPGYPNNYYDASRQQQVPYNHHPPQQQHPPQPSGHHPPQANVQQQHYPPTSAYAASPRPQAPSPMEARPNSSYYNQATADPAARYRYPSGYGQQRVPMPVANHVPQQTIAHKPMMYQQQQQQQHHQQTPPTSASSSHQPSNFNMMNGRSHPFSEQPPMIKKEIFPSDRHLRQALSSDAFKQESGLREDTVESTKYVVKRFKRITSVGHVDSRKILLSLKSGLLAETTWALDTLNILSCNNLFRLQHSPSVTNYLLEYYKKYLNCLFDDIFADTENDFPLKICKSACNDKSSESVESLITKGDKVFLLDSTNYTYKSRNGLPVKVKRDHISTQCIVDYTDFEEACDFQYLAEGNSASSQYIITGMDSPIESVSFLRKAVKDDETSANGANKPSTSPVKPESPVKKRNRQADFESEMYRPELDTFCPRLESIEVLIKRCCCISTIIRNFSFLPENASHMAEHSALLLVLARLLGFNHKHIDKPTFGILIEALDSKTTEELDEEARGIFTEFPNDALTVVRMNSLVTLSNLSEYLDLSRFPDKIIITLLDSLLHWAGCESALARDQNPPDNLPIQTLAFETLAKLSIIDSNVDLILATPPFSRLEELYKVMVRYIGKETEDQVLRELSLVILANCVRNDGLSARIVLHQDFAILNLVTFIEQYDTTMRMNEYYNHYHQQQYVEPPFTIIYMLKQAASVLRNVTHECTDAEELMLVRRFEERLVELAMSSYLHPEVTQILADLVFILNNKKQAK